MQWAKELKIAIVEENENKIEMLIEKLPEFDSLEQMQAAAFLISEAHKLLINKKEELATKLLKIKKQKEFLDSGLTTRSTFNQMH